MIAVEARPHMIAVEARHATLAAHDRGGGPARHTDLTWWQLRSCTQYCMHTHTHTYTHHLSRPKRTKEAKEGRRRGGGEGGGRKRGDSSGIYKSCISSKVPYSTLQWCFDCWRILWSRVYCQPCDSYSQHCISVITLVVSISLSKSLTSFFMLKPSDQIHHPLPPVSSA